jgi:hypothetical protein
MLVFNSVGARRHSDYAVDQMRRFGLTRLRLLGLAVLVALSGGSQRVEVRAWTVGASADHSQAVEATTLLASLPSNLAPTLEPGLQLVAMVAADIDDDGDLDLVGDDGSLNLLVWINDGTGHLTRRYAHPSGGWSEDAQTANDDASHTTVSAVAASSVSLGPGPTLSLALTDNGALRSAYDQPHLDSCSARSQSPRAPPFSPASL